MLLQATWGNLNLGPPYVIDFNFLLYIIYVVWISVANPQEQLVITNDQGDSLLLYSVPRVELISFSCSAVGGDSWFYNVLLQGRCRDLEVYAKGTLCLDSPPRTNSRLEQSPVPLNEEWVCENPSPGFTSFNKGLVLPMLFLFLFVCLSLLG